MSISPIPQRRTISPEALFRLRRLRQARRLFKRAPLFAYHWMQQEYRDYSHQEFLTDLRPSNTKKWSAKSTLIRYGRYFRMRELLREYFRSRDINVLHKAQLLRQRMTKPYQIRCRIDGVWLDYQLPATVAIATIEDLMVKLNSCHSEHQADEMVKACTRYGA